MTILDSTSAAAGEFPSTKTCTLCGAAKPRTREFWSLHGPSKDGLAPRCKTCLCEAARVMRESRTPEQQRRKAECDAKWRADNRDRFNSNQRAWSAANLAKRSRSCAAYLRARRRVDPHWARSMDQASVFRDGLIRRQRAAGGPVVSEARFVRTFGYSIDTARRHFEALFRGEMDWDRVEWEVDHRKPISAFGYPTTEDANFRECWALDNLQPLTKAENIAKGSRWAS